MLLKDIIRQINRLISNNSSYNLNFEKLEFYIDSAIDRINEVLKTEFPTPREHFEANAVDEIISYYDKYLGVVPELPAAFDVLDDGSVCFLHPGDQSTPSGYYIKLNGQFVLVNDLYQMIDYISFSKTDISYFIDKYNYSLIPDKYIRKIIIYFAAALYLEEEDELENQYAIFKDKAEQSLLEWQRLDFSVYDLSNSNYQDTICKTEVAPAKKEKIHSDELEVIIFKLDNINRNIGNINLILDTINGEVV